ncbi:MAG: divergent polysaccharide deacetylase family protein [Syntrophales bacterium]|nr:divergent polysaccharide deacetylase family protein [Syntrophales bacterium]
MKKNKRRRRKKTYPFLWILALSLLLVLLIGTSIVYFLHSEKEKQLPVAEKPVATVQTIPRAVIKKIAPPPVTDIVPKKHMAIVIDDIGYDTETMEKLLSFGVPITFGVLPHCPHSYESAVKAHTAGHDVILHLPMEPVGYPEKNPGEGALLVSMTNEEIRQVLKKNMQSVPHISGVNNHMGSRFMEDKEKLIVVFSELQKQGLYFMDSFTTHLTKGKKAAMAANIDYIQRDIFIDNSGNQDETFSILIEIIDNVDRWNRLVVIGHPYWSTLWAIERTIPYFLEQEIELVPLSFFVDR